MAEKPDWDIEAQQRLKKIPFFIRPLAKRKVEQEALRLGQKRISIAFLDQVKQGHHNA